MKKKYDCLAYLNSLGIDYKEQGTNIMRNHVGISCLPCGDDPSTHMNITPDGTHCYCVRCGYQSHDSIDILRKVIIGENPSFKECLDIFSEYPYGREELPKKSIEIIDTKKYRFEDVWNQFSDLNLACKDYLQKRGFDIIFCELLMNFKSGNVLKVRGKDYDFKNRVIIPIRNAEGEIVNFSGRHIGRREPRYKNCSLELVQEEAKGCLFGLYESLNTVNYFNFVVLVEGILTCLMLLQYGIPSVALMKKKLTQEQYQVLLRYFRDKRLYISLDSEGADKKDWEDLENKLGLLFDVRILYLKGAKDFAECSGEEILELKKILTEKEIR